ncbi:hypothetical protein FE257_012768 [Aspergillus nanangensis]|uniref:Uncharacterized protein n=1 Tax=Aspergillus nanangensis TaxID=2582783 RepID=A0AAD4CFW9_ASPNN|nr:hypothetical protein FE257_012768 [Aspergillus nanangensis]
MYSSPSWAYAFASPRCRAGAKCTGFRDLRALLIQDESAQVMHKAGLAQATDTAAQTASKPSSKRPQILTHSYLERSAPSLMYPLSLPLRDQPRQFFIHHYILDYSPLSHGQMSCFQTIYSQAPVSGYLSNAVDAVGMASLANLNYGPHLKHAAYENYSSVLREINLALASNSHTVSYEILVTVMLLNVFETVTCDGNDLISWNKHEGGELALVHLWNMDQLESPLGRKIFLQLRDDILISCLQRQTTVPSIMAKWVVQARKVETDLEKPSGDLAEIVVQICSLVSSASHSSFEGDLSRYISETFSIDEALQTWSALHKNEFKTAEGAIFQENYLHLSLPMVKTYNVYCCSRIILHKALHRVISQRYETMRNSSFITPSSLSYNSTLIASYAAIRDSISSICSSVPSFRSGSGDQQRSKDLVRAGRCMDLIWPLFVAGTAYATTPSEREWISLRLREIGEFSGVQRANVAASHVQYQSLHY